MTFAEFKKSISKVKKIELSGAEFHEEMAPRKRREQMKKWDPVKKKPFKAGVLALFFPGSSGETKLLLILRKKYEGVHSGQIALPGGRMEVQDKNLLETALRETWEEVGAEPRNIEIWRELTEIYIPPSNFLVRPFLGTIDETPRFVPQESEVEAIIEVDLNHFLDESFLIETQMTTSYATNITVRAFQFNEHIVWGATGMILNEVKALLKMVL
ncbi:MAG TPA: CoA pyrophosphatase [Flavobacteriaceae bacterium]|nr:CoA pyrophosphatase [Flavobacteriaceae bacterium]